MNDPNPDRLVALDVRCPSCGRREARRVAAWTLDLYRDADPGRIVETVQCRCRTIYGVTAAAYQDARTVGRRDAGPVDRRVRFLSSE